LDRKVALDLPLNERGGYAKFGCTGSYRDQMHKEQTNFLVDIYIDRLSSLLSQGMTIDAIFYRNCVETKVGDDFANNFAFNRLPIHSKDRNMQTKPAIKLSFKHFEIIS